jgi:hypothetical protein
LVEISPFCQSDLDQSEVFVADAFFELYMYAPPPKKKLLRFADFFLYLSRVLGVNSQHKRAEFQLALQFAQEYAILAASVNDRPKIPASSVIIGGGAPGEFKASFRNWEDLRASTTATAWEASPQVVALSAAMEAMEFVQ